MSSNPGSSEGRKTGMKGKWRSMLDKVRGSGKSSKPATSASSGVEDWDGWKFCNAQPGDDDYVPWEERSGQHTAKSGNQEPELASSRASMESVPSEGVPQASGNSSGYCTGRNLGSGSHSRPAPGSNGRDTGFDSTKGNPQTQLPSSSMMPTDGPPSLASRGRANTQAGAGSNLLQITNTANRDPDLPGGQGCGDPPSGPMFPDSGCGGRGSSFGGHDSSHHGYND